LWILAIGAIAAGYVGLPKLWFGESGNLWEQWLKPVMFIEPEAAHSSLSLEWGAMVLSIAVALFGIWIATKFYRNEKETPAKIAAKAGGFYTLILNKYYVDEIYSKTVIRPLMKLSEAFSWFDKWIVDGAVNTSAHVSEISGHLLKFTQTGYLRNYALFFFFALVLIIYFVVF
jgi:NADH-quinone oxidoreductase subunit L